MPHVSKAPLTPVADDPGSPSVGRPSQGPSVGASSHTVANPPNRAKLHQGSASLPEWSAVASRAGPDSRGEPVTLRPAKIHAARAGVSVMALIAEMIIATE